MTTDPLLETHGFPAGYFVTLLSALLPLLDVHMDDTEDGTEILLWPEKESSIVETRRSTDANNQVFFIDPSGALWSRSVGHAIDIEDDCLVIHRRRPASLPYPNAYSHPLPVFQHSAETGEITVRYTSDPSHPPPSAFSSDTWRTKTYVLASIPLCKPKSILDDAHAFISSAITTPLSFFTGATPPKATPEAVFSTNIDFAEDEVLEEECREEAEMDDSPEWGRKVRVLGIVNKSREEREIIERARNRRGGKSLPFAKLTRAQCK